MTRRDDGAAVVLVTVAHPDDETFALGSVIAALAAQGAAVHVCCATRGEAGEDATGTFGSPAELGAARTGELVEAAGILGAACIEQLDFADSGWDGPAPPGALVDGGELLVAALAPVIDRLRPGIVVTMDPTGSDGHRDHAAIGAATTTAFKHAALPDASLYHWCLVRSLMQRWVDEKSVRDEASVYTATTLGRPDAEITTVVDGRAVLARRVEAIAAHRTQASPFAGLSPELTDAFLTVDHFVRVVPAWTGGPIETVLVAPPRSS